MSAIHRSSSSSPHPAAISASHIEHYEAIQRDGLKVLLRRGSNGLKLSAHSGLRLVDPATSRELIRFTPPERAQLLAAGSRLVAGGRKLDVREAMLAPIDPDEQLSVGGTRYRGQIFIKANGESLLLVNEVSLDQYLYGVLPSEIGASWPRESLKAQAVAARTYALFRASQVESTLYDLDDSTRSQVYLGTSKEEASTNAAVDSTSGLVLAYDGKPAETFFHANCGGHTADVATVWGGQSAYLRGVEDSFCEEGKHYLWRTELDHEVVLKRLNAAGFSVRDFDSVETDERDRSGRCTTVVLKGSEPLLKLKATAFRTALGADVLRSTNFKALRHGETHVFEGRGWGHGIGLCQEGAKGMATAGYSWRDILNFYFPGTKVRRLVE